MNDNLFPFTASNGWKIDFNESASRIAITVGDGGGAQTFQFVPSQVKALREFFQAERDASLGRWRSKEHPDYVVYPNRYGQVNVLHEPDGLSSRAYGRGEFPGTTGRFPNIAAEFFAAHPEPKPWHDAKPGEGWALKYDRKPTEHLVLCRDSGAGGEFVTDDGTAHRKNYPNITAGRRIFPEVNS